METVVGSDVLYTQVFRVILEEEGFEGCASIEHWGSPELMLEGVRQLKEVLQNL